MSLELILQCKIKDEAGFEAIAKDLPSSVEANESGTLAYRWFRNGDDVLLLDTYASPEAFVKHFEMNKANGLLDRCMAALDIRAVHGVGQSNEAASAILAELGATEYKQVAGFTRTTAAITH